MVSAAGLELVEDMTQSAGSEDYSSFPGRRGDEVRSPELDDAYWAKVLEWSGGDQDKALMLHDYLRTADDEWLLDYFLGSRDERRRRSRRKSRLRFARRALIIGPILLLAALGLLVILSGF